MKRRLNRVLSLLMTCAMVTSNIPVYAAGETASDTTAEVAAESTIEADDEAEEPEEDLPAEEPVKEDVSDDAAPAEDDAPVAEEADAEDGEYVDITGECTIDNGVLKKYTGTDHAYIAIPSSVTEIADNVFQGKKEIKGVKFPSGLKNIGYRAFSNCTELELVELPTANPLVIEGSAFSYTSMGKGTSNGDLVIPANVTSIGSSAFSNCSMLGTVTIAGGSGTIELGATTFGYNDRISKITLSERTPELPENFAYGCEQLEEVVWPANLKKIDDHAFQGDIKLTSSDLSQTVLTYIGYNAFGSCTMFPIVKLPTASSLEIAGYAFSRTSMNNGTDEGDLVIPANVTKIGSNAFAQCPMLGTVDIVAGSSTIELESAIFNYDERLTSIKLSDRVTVVPSNFANNCKLLTEVTWPTTLKTIGDNAFSEDESLISSDLSKTVVTNIGYHAFLKCTAFPLVKLPESGTMIIEGGAFQYTNMNDGMNTGELMIPANVAEIGTAAFANCGMLGKVTFAAGGSAVKFGGSVFSYDERLTKIILSDRVTEISDSFAIHCAALEEVVWPAEITTIGDYAFFEDLVLKSSDFSNTALTSIGYEAFSGCKALPLVKFPEKGSITLSGYAFARTAMNDGAKDGTLIIPASVKSMGTFVFSGCTNLGEVKVEDGGSTLIFDTNTFYECPRLVKITLSDRVGQIPGGFAYYCQSLIQLSNTAKVTKISDYAFYVSQECEMILENPSQQVLGYDWAKDNRVLTDSACSVVFSQDKYSVEAGKTIKLDPTITVYPAGAATPKLVWKSGNENYATVDSNGNVKGIKETSSVYITVETAEGIVKGRVQIQVVKKGETPDPGPSDPIPGGTDPTDPQPAIKNDTTSLILVKGQKFVMAEKDWKSSAKKVVKVKKGKVEAKNSGTATLSRSGKTINVQVIAPSFAEKSVNMVAGEEKAVTLSDTGSLDVYYTSTNPDVASVDADGNVTAHGKGKTIIQAYVNGAMRKCTVVVKEFDTAAKTFADTVEIAPLQTVTVKAPGFNAKKASWSSSDQEAKADKAKGVVYEDAIVRITDKGKLTAVGVGSTTLTATGGGTELQFTVKVDEPIEKELHLNVGSKKAFKLTGTKNQPDWTIEDQTVASKDKGKIIGAKAGETTMTGTCEGFTYTVKVYVEDPKMTGLSGKPYNYTATIKKGETLDLDLSGVYQPIAFKSNKSHVAFIGIDGKLYARTKGSANITTRVNGKTVKIKVTVTN